MPLSFLPLVSNACPYFLRPALDRLRRSPIGCRLARGAFWCMAGALISRALMLTSSVLVARMLGSKGFGELGIIQGTVNAFGVFAGFGLGRTANKYVAELREKDTLRVSRILAVSGLTSLVAGSLMSILLFAFAPWLATHTLAAPRLTGVLRLSAPLLLLAAMNGAQNGALAGFEAFKAIAFRNLWAGVLTFPLMVIGVWFFDLYGAVYGLIGGACVNWVLNHLAIRRECKRWAVRLTFDKCRREWKILVHFALPTFLAGITYAPVRWVSNALLVNQPDGYAEMGIYNASCILHIALVNVGNFVGAPLLSIINNELGNRSDRLEKINMLSTWFLTLVFVMPVLAFPELIQKLFGKDFDGYSFNATLVIVVLSTSVMIFQQGITRKLAACNMMWWATGSNLVWAVVLVPCVYWGVRYGAVGYALAFLVAYVVNMCMFIPFYLARDLVPRNTIISLEAVGIWAVLVQMVAVVYLGVGIGFRCALFPAQILLVLWWCRRLAHRS